jgi:hypothetical protein
MIEAWTFIDGMKVSVPLDRCDAVRYGWHLGTEFRRWHPLVDVAAEILRENSIRDWCRNTVGQNCYKTFHDSVYFYREADAVLCKLRWS